MHPVLSKCVHSILTALEQLHNITVCVKSLTDISCHKTGQAIENLSLQLLRLCTVCAPYGLPKFGTQCVWYAVRYPPSVWSLQELYKQALPAGPDEHQLQYCYSFRFSQRPQGGARQAAEKYEQNVKLVGCFSTVEQFWSYYCYMKRPGDLASPCDIHLFKVGIAPIWEVCRSSTCVCSCCLCTPCILMPCL